MSGTLKNNFSHRFNGVVWNAIASSTSRVILLEVRNPRDQSVSFAALDRGRNEFLWRDKMLEEKWWINATALVGDKVLFTVYTDTNNPDKKGIVACSVHDLRLLWWNNDFSASEIFQTAIKGAASKFGFKDVLLDLETGKEIREAPELLPLTIPGLQKPVQYAEGMEYFDTVKTFLASRLNLHIFSALEYLETNNRIVISCNARSGSDTLVNYLLVLSDDGSPLLHEAIGVSDKGIGFDTFFVLDHDLFFIRNKTEFVSYAL